MNGTARRIEEEGWVEQCVCSLSSNRRQRCGFVGLPAASGSMIYLCIQRGYLAFPTLTHATCCRTRCLPVFRWSRHVDGAFRARPRDNLAVAAQVVTLSSRSWLLPRALVPLTVTCHTRSDQTYLSRSVPILKNFESNVISTFIGATIRCSSSCCAGVQPSTGAACEVQCDLSNTASLKSSLRSLEIDDCWASTESRHASSPNSHALRDGTAPKRT